MYGLKITLTNETEEHVFSDFREDLDRSLLTDNGEPDFGEIYRSAQQEYGRCTSSVYVDTKEGKARRIGWFFISRSRYSDSSDTYLRGAWVSIVEITPPPAPVYVTVP